MLSKRARADLAMGFCTVIWGATFVVIKDALADISVFMYIAVRFSLAAIVMAFVFWASLRRMDRRTLWAGVQIGICMFGGYAFQTVGLRFTTPAKAAFITGMCVVLVPLMLAVFGRRRITIWIWSGAAAALAGLYFLTVPREGLGALNLGDPIVFGCAVMFALHIIFIGRYAGQHSVGSLAFLQVATTAVLSVTLLPILAAASWEKLRMVISETVIFAILITSIGATVIAFSFQTWVQQHTSPSHVAILISLEPVFAALTSWLLVREHFGIRTLAGAALIFAGILLAEMKGATPAAPESMEPAGRTAE